jgi:phage terminase small subunit
VAKPTPPQPKKIRKSAVTTKEALYAEARSTGLSIKSSNAAAGLSTTNKFASAEIEKRPNVRDLIDTKKRANAYMLGLTRDDVLQGMMDAIDQAKVLADPLTQIVGWRELAKVCGFYAPEVKRIELSEGARGYIQRLESMSDEQLMQIATADAIEADYEEVQEEKR